MRPTQDRRHAAHLRVLREEAMKLGRVVLSKGYIGMDRRTLRLDTEYEGPERRDRRERSLLPGRSKVIEWALFGVLAFLAHSWTQNLQDTIRELKDAVRDMPSAEWKVNVENRLDSADRVHEQLAQGLTRGERARGRLERKMDVLLVKEGVNPSSIVAPSEKDDDGGS